MALKKDLQAQPQPPSLTEKLDFYKMNKCHKLLRYKMYFVRKNYR